MKEKRIAAAVLAALLLAGAACGRQTAPDAAQNGTEVPSSAVPTAEPESEAAPEETAPRCNPLNGDTEYDEQYASTKIVGIVVENQPAARPQWGMSTPEIVMEYEVEGGISRMLWLYANPDEVPEKAGPVRSARHDIVELALGFDMLFVHCGGSPAALQKIKQYAGTLDEIEGLTGDSAFVRDKSRNVALEHTLVCVGEKLRASINAHGIDMAADPAKTRPFRFAGTPRTLTGGDASRLEPQYSNPYKYTFAYDADAGKYACSLNGKAVQDDAGVRIAYTNVLVLFTGMRDVGDKDGHQDLLLENGGDGLYLCGGKMENIRWEKGGDTDPLRLLSADGGTLVLNPGNSYIGFVRSTYRSKTTVD